MEIFENIDTLKRSKEPLVRPPRGHQWQILNVTPDPNPRQLTVLLFLKSFVSLIDKTSLLKVYAYVTLLKMGVFHVC